MLVSLKESISTVWLMLMVISIQMPLLQFSVLLIQQLFKHFKINLLQQSQVKPWQQSTAQWMLSWIWELFSKVWNSYSIEILFDNSDLMNNEIELSNFAAVYNDFASAVTQLDSAFGNQILGPSTNALLRIISKKIFAWALCRWARWFRNRSKLFNLSHNFGWKNSSCSRITGWYQNSFQKCKYFGWIRHWRYSW